MNSDNAEQDQTAGPMVPKIRETIAPFDGSVRPIKPGDTVTLRLILEEWVRDSNNGDIIEAEIDGFMAAMNQNADGIGDRRYVVAETGKSQVVGVMGQAAPDQQFLAFAQSDRPVEIVNGFVTATQRGSGVGKKLFASLEQLARQYGYTEMIVSSGPRYEETGWPFWTSLFGPPVAVLQNHYGPGQHAPVWRKSLA